MRRLIIGSDGFIGSSISKDWDEKNIPCHASTRKRNLVSKKRPFINLNHPEEISSRHHYNLIVITAAISDLYECEKNPELTRKINVINTCKIVKKLSNDSTHIVFFSSNQVFDGAEPFRKSTDKKKPINEYGRQKSEIENLLLEYSSNTCIIRMTKVIHNNLPLIRTWKRSLSKSNIIYPFYDMKLAPVSIDQVIDFTNILISRRSTGIYHLPSKKDMTYEDLAYKVCRSIKADESLIHPISYSSVLPRNLNLPKYTSLI